MQRDGRTLDPATLETIRLMAVERVREGKAAAAVIASYGFNRTTIYEWLAAAGKPGVVWPIFDTCSLRQWGKLLI